MIILNHHPIELIIYLYIQKHFYLMINNLVMFFFLNYYDQLFQFKDLLQMIIFSKEYVMINYNYVSHLKKQLLAI